MNSQLDHYEVLGLSKKARPAEIRAKFHELARIFHPDRYRSEDVDTAQRVFVRINAAYNTLIDPQKREKYDKKLKAAGGKHDVAMAPSKEQGPIEASSTEQVHKWISDAQTEHDKGRLGPARELCEKAINFDYSEWTAHALLGDIHAERARFHEALSCYRLALLLNPASSITKEKIRRLEAQLGPTPVNEKKETSKGLHLFLERLIGKSSKKKTGKSKGSEATGQPIAMAPPPSEPIAMPPAREKTLR
jgi:curved DNA-binding protein CbpA